MDKDYYDLINKELQNFFTNYNLKIKFKSFQGPKIVFSYRNSFGILNISLEISNLFKRVSSDFLIGMLHLTIKSNFNSFLKNKFLKRFIKVDATFNEPLIKLATNFLKHFSDFNFKDYENDSLLQLIYDELNLKYFNSELTPTRLLWSNGIKTLGSYNYSTNTIRISKLLRQDIELLKYVMFHEMLHKYIKFSFNKRFTFHTQKFRKLENSYPNSENLEKRLKKLVNEAIRKKKKRFFLLFLLLFFYFFNFFTPIFYCFNLFRI